jgi:imidazolonepropionase-like amidohydrolase
MTTVKAGLVKVAASLAVVTLLAGSARALRGAAAAQLERWTCDQSPLLIRNARVWSPAGIRARRDIWIQDGVIHRIEPPGRSPVRGMRAIDAEGTTVLPGLVDAHVHLDTLPGPLPTSVAVSREQMISIAARQTLMSGVTAARMHLADETSGPTLAREASAPCFAGPRLSMGGPGLIGGAPQLTSRLMRGVSDPDHGRRLVREVARQGFRWLAVHDSHKFEPDTLGAIVDEARQGKIRLMMSADSFADLEAGLQHGADSLEYLNRTTAPAYPVAVLKALTERRQRVVLVAPIGCYTRYRTYKGSPSAVNQSAHVPFYPPAIAETFLNALQLQFETGAENDIDRSYGTLASKFAQLRATGALMAIGSDSGSPGQFHIDAIWHEMRAWRALGVPAADVVKAATTTSASLMESTTATLKIGDRADLILYRGDVRDGRFDRARVRTVVKQGILFVNEYRWVGPG